jgi:hypothetical protein
VSPVFETASAFYALEMESSEVAGVLPLATARGAIEATLLFDSKMERGRAQAVGLTVDPSRLEGLREAWEASSLEWDDEPFVRHHEYELAMAPGEVNDALVDELLHLEPHGQGNPRPLLRVGPLRLVGTPRIFGKRERRHLGGEAEGEDGGRVKLLGWGWAERAPALARPFEVLAHLERDRYDGRPVLRLVDSRPHDGR